MRSDKHMLIRTAPRYPGYINVLLFCGTISACVGVALCVYSITCTVGHIAWITGTVTFTIGVVLSVVSMMYIGVTVMRKRTIEASWVQNSASPYEDDFATDYYFNDDSYGFVYKPTTYAAPNLMVSSKPIPAVPNAYQLVYGADQK